MTPENKGLNTRRQRWRQEFIDNLWEALDTWLGQSIYTFAMIGVGVGMGIAFGYVMWGPK